MSIRRSMVQMLLARQASVVVMALAMVALGRLLTPEEFGVFAAMLAVVGLFEVLIRFGIVPRLTQMPRMDAAELRAGQGLSLALGTGAATVLLLAVLLLPEGVWPAGARPVLAVLALGLPFLATLETLEVAYTRDLNVGLVARFTVLRQTVESAAAVALAFAGFGALALALALLAHRIVGAVALWWAARHGSGFRPRLSGWRPFATYARSYLGMDVAAKAGDALVVLVLSRMLGLDLLGQFNRAKRVIGLLDDTLLTGIQPVVLPALSRSIDAGVPTDRIYLAKVNHLAALCWPAFGFIALMAEDIVQVLLGGQWDAAVGAVRILALAGLVLPITKMSVNMFVALDAAGAYSRIQTVHQGVRVAFVALGATVSLEAACLGAALSSFVKAAMVTRSVKRRTGYSRRDMGVVVARAAAVAAGALAGPSALVLLAPDWPAALHLAVAALLAALGWVAAAAIARHALLGEALAALGASGLAARLRTSGAA